MDNLFNAQKVKHSLQKAGAFRGLRGQEIKLQPRTLQYVVAYRAFKWEKKKEKEKKKALKLDKKERKSAKPEKRKENAICDDSHRRAEIRQQNWQVTKRRGRLEKLRRKQAESCKQAAFLMYEKPLFFPLKGG